MNLRKKIAVAVAAAFATLCVSAANHREAPITALDHKADITDVYAFRSYGGDSATPRVTLIMSVDPLLEPANGPNWFPFDPDILYELKIDNTQRCRRRHRVPVPLRHRAAPAEPVPGLCRGARRGGCACEFAGTGAAGHADRAAADHQLRRSSASGSARATRSRWSRAASRDRSRRRAHLLCGAGERRSAHDGLRGAVQRRHLRAGRPSIKVFAGTTDDAFWIDLGGGFRHAQPALDVAPGVLSARLRMPRKSTSRRTPYRDTRSTRSRSRCRSRC